MSEINSLSSNQTSIHIKNIGKIREDNRVTLVKNEIASLIDEFKGYSEQTGIEDKKLAGIKED